MHAPKQLPFLKYHAKYPKRTLAGACGCLCATLILVVILALTVSSFFPYTNEVPLYVRDDPAQERMDAVKAGQRDATLTLALPPVQLLRSVSEVQTVESKSAGDELTLELLYLSKRGDVFTLSALSAILALENQIRAAPGYTQYCALDWPQAALDAEAVDPVATAAANASPPRCLPPKSALWHCEPGRTNASDCSAPSARPVGLLDCTDTAPGAPSCDPSMAGGAVLNAQFRNLKLAQYADPAASPNPFLAYAQSVFGDENVNSPGLRSVFQFALPLPGYASIEDRPEDQEEAIKTFLFDTYHSMLFEYDSPEFTLLVKGFGMQTKYLDTLVPQDLSLAIGSFVAVLVYMALITQSWYLAFMGLGQIFLSFAPAYLIYRVVLQQASVSTFSLLSLYLILAIGADDVFLSIDVFNESRKYAKFGLGPRLSHAWTHSASAMLVTSITTIVSLLANASSAFPALSSFGFLAASLVFANYILVIIFFPAVLTFFATVIVPSRFSFCCGLTGFLSRHCPPDACRDVDDGRYHDPAPGALQLGSVQHWTDAYEEGQSTSTDSDESSTSSSSSSGDDEESTNTATEARFLDLENDGDVMYVAGGGDDDSDEEDRSKSMIVRCFEGPYATFIVKMRYTLCIAFLALFIWAVVMSTRLVPDPDPPQMLPEGNMYQDYNPVLVERFARGPSVFSVKQRFVHGFVPDDPISRTDTSEYDPDDIGEPRFDPRFSIAHAFECMASILEDAEPRQDGLATGGPPSYQVDSFVLPFKAWMVSEYGADTYGRATGPAANETLFRELAVEFLSIGTNFDTYSPYIYATVGTDGDRTTADVRFVYSELRLTASRYVAYEDGIDLFKAWDAFMGQKQGSSPACVAAAAAGYPSDGFQYSAAAVFWFIQEKLVSEAFFGMFLSLLLATIVLVIATGNVFVGLLAGATIAAIVITVLAVLVAIGWKLGVLQSIILVLVPGLSVDYVAHLSHVYSTCAQTSRKGRTRAALAAVGISIVSGAVSTMLASGLLLFATITFFFQFGIGIFITIVCSLAWSLLFLPSALSSFGPQGKTGDWKPWVMWVWVKVRGMCGGEGAGVQGGETETGSTASYLSSSSS